MGGSIDKATGQITLVVKKDSNRLIGQTGGDENGDASADDSAMSEDESLAAATKVWADHDG